MRILSRIVLPSLLAAVCVTPISATTIAYWQFDQADILSSSLNGTPYDLTAVEGPTQAGSAAEAVDPIPNPDVSVGFSGDPSSNAGSMISDDAENGFLQGGSNSRDGLFLATSKWTFEGWINKTDDLNPGDVDVIFNTRDTGNVAGLLFDVRGTNDADINLFVDGGTPNSGDIVFSGVVSPGDWQHLALTWDSALSTNGRFELFMDGTSVGTHDLAASVLHSGVDGGSVDQLELAGRDANGANSFGGFFDEFRISDQALIPSQFLNAANASMPEPTTFMLGFLALPGFGFFGWRRKRR